MNDHLRQFYHGDGQCFSQLEQDYFTGCIDQIMQQLICSTHSNAAQAVAELINTFTDPTSPLPAQQLRMQLTVYFKYHANDPFATELHQLAARFPQYEGYCAGDEVIFPQGYQQMITPLCKQLNIHTDVIVKSVVLHDDHIELYD